MTNTEFGRRVGIRPKRYDDWVVVPNLWGLVVGPPGLLKTPMLREILKPLMRLAARAREERRDRGAGAVRALVSPPQAVAG